MDTCFGEYSLHPDLFELRHCDSIVELEPQVFNLLNYLAANRDRVISKDELIEVVWNGRIVSDEAIASRISSARRAVGDDGKAQHTIKTISRIGFRFVADVFDDPKTVSASQFATPNIKRETREKPVIAVIPFLNLSDDANQQYLADGMTADVIASLSLHRWLSVLGRSATFDLKSQNMPADELGAKLGADYIVEGSLRKNGTKLRITASIIDVKTAVHIWGETYDRGMRDIFELQDEITATIVARVEPELGFAERHRVERLPRTNLQAWDCLYLGISHFYKFTAADNQIAQELLEQSLRLDPSFGEAQCWWAYATVLGMVYWDTEPSDQLLDRAMAAIDLALKSDPQNALFYSIKGRVALARKEYEVTIAGCKKAISLNPTYAAAYCAMGDALAYDGHYEDATKQFEKALALSPNDPQKWAFLSYGALAQIFGGKFATAIEWANQASIIPNRQYWTIAHKAVAQAHLGLLKEAHASADMLQTEKPGFSVGFAREKLFYLKRQDQIDTYLEGLRMAGLPE
jgi:adenylate cyclase